MFVGQTNIAQTCVAHSVIFHGHHDTSHVSTDVIRKQWLFSNFADKLAGTISIGVLCMIATHWTQIYYSKLSLCARLRLVRIEITGNSFFCNSTPHIFTRTQCSFINNTSSLCRVEDYNKTWLLPGVPRDTF